MPYKQILFCALSICILFVQGHALECGSCMDNFVSCINETSYVPCFDDATTFAPIEEDELYYCPTGYVCTNSENVCEPQSAADVGTIVNVCSGENAAGSACGQCKAEGQFVCRSPTQFSICRTQDDGAGGTVLQPVGLLACPTEQFCSEDLKNVANLNKVCAPKAVLDYLSAKLTCNNAEITTTTTTTVPPSNADAYAICAQSDKTSGYFLLPNPSNCNSYIYCEFSASGLIAMEMKCKPGQWYSTAQQKCITASLCPH